MKGLSIIGGILLGTFIGGAMGFLIASYGSRHDDEGAAYTIIAWLVLMGGAGAVAGGVLAARLVRDFSDESSRSISPRVRAKIIAAIVCGAPLLTIAALYSPLNKFRPPSDQQMITEFHRSKPGLEQVLAISKEYNQDDPAQAVRYDPTKISDIPDYRLNRSLDALWQADLPGGYQIDAKAQSITFDDWESAPMLDTEGDTAKGFAYFAAPPRNVQQSLDQFHVSGKAEITAYRHIEGNWYLYFNYQPIPTS